MNHPDLPPAIRCKKCSLDISAVAAEESVRRMRVYLEAAGNAAEFTETLLDRAGPLCRRCMIDWGDGEDDL
jgi:hypothetical protein